MTPQRRVQVRHPDLDAQLSDVPKHFMADGDLVTSHLMAVMSAIFPPGEDYFVRAVERVADRVTDPDLLAQVDAFIGQEDQHGEQHRRLNRTLATHGYPVGAIDRYVEWVSRTADRHLSPEANVAITAALEHHTAVVAETLLGVPEARARFGHDGVLELLSWHALEESEHKAVAFDVFRHIGGSEKLRIRAMHAMNLAFGLEIATWTLISLLRDPDTWHQPGRAVASLARLRSSPFLSRRFFRRLVDYNRPGYHPDDVDTSDLVAHWRSKLFGAGGQITDRLAS